MDKTYLNKVTQNIWQKVNHNQLEAANELLSALLNSGEFKNFIFSDAKNPSDSFLNSFASRFQFSVCPDSEPDTSAIDAPTKYTRSRFLTCITDIDGIFFVFLHEYLHSFCHFRWLNVADDKASLDPIEIDFLEDLFGYALVINDFASLYRVFGSQLDLLADFLGLAKDDSYYKFAGLYDSSYTPSFERLAKIKKWLFTNRELKHPATFQIFVRYFFILKNFPEFTEYMKFRTMADRIQKDRNKLNAKQTFPR